jgi:hypothetical protein
MLCSLIEVYQHFGGMYHLHLQSLKFYSTCCLLGLLFDSEAGGSIFLWNVGKLVPITWHRSCNQSHENVQSIQHFLWRYNSFSLFFSFVINKHNLHIETDGFPLIQETKLKYVDLYTYSNPFWCILALSIWIMVLEFIILPSLFCSV